MAQSPLPKPSYSIGLGMNPIIIATFLISWTYRIFIEEVIKGCFASVTLRATELGKYKGLISFETP